MGASSNINNTNIDVDLDLSALRKKRIRIDGDDNKIIEINTSDMGVMGRLQNSYDRLMQLATDYTKEEIEDDSKDDTIEALAKIDAEMKEIVDYVFDANISEICVQDGTMADPFNGKFRFEHIIEKFLELYDANFTKEFKKMSANVQKHTGKYAGKK